MRKSLVLGLVLPFVATTAHAVAIVPVITSTPGTTYNTAALTDYSTVSREMIGSLVTVRFANGSSNSASWTASGASNTGWSLSVSGDTISSPWTFTNKGSTTISGFSFNGVPGNTTFDIVGSPTDSPGSSNGKPMSSVNGPSGLTVAALYTNRLQVGGKFYGDLYTLMDVSLGGTGLMGGGVLTYVTDTDNALESAGGITSAVPEAATWAMMMVGMGLVGASLRRRQKVSTRVSFA